MFFAAFSILAAYIAADGTIETLATALMLPRAPVHSTITTPHYAPNMAVFDFL